MVLISQNNRQLYCCLCTFMKKIGTVSYSYVVFSNDNNKKLARMINYLLEYQEKNISHKSYTDFLILDGFLFSLSSLYTL